MPTKRPTISDVARLSGFSKTTVSKVMNIPPEQLDVPESTRQRVLAASEELGYNPSWRALALAKGKTHTIGLMHVAELPMFASEVWQAMVSPLISALHDAGYDAQFVPAKLGGDRWKRLLTDQRFDGVVIFHELLPEVSKAITSARLPIVLLNALDDRYPSVVPDDRLGARLLTQHLIGLGHRNIAYIDHTPHGRHFSYAQRRGGYLDAMNDAGYLDHALPISDWEEQTMKRLLAAKPTITGVVAYSADASFHLLHGLWRRGLRVPEDMSVVTFNDVDLTRHSNPPLTCCAVPAAELGRRAAELLVKEIEAVPGKSPPLTGRRIVLPEHLILRESTRAL